VRALTAIAFAWWLLNVGIFSLEATMRRVYATLLARTRLVKDPSTRGLVSRIMATSTYAVATIVGLGTIGVDTSPVLAAMGVSGATIGFACKDIGANVAAGLSLAAQRPFQHGTRLTIGSASNGFTGVVDRWDMRYLYLRGENDVLVHVPNSTVFTSVLTVHNPNEGAFLHSKGEFIHLPHLSSLFQLEGAPVDPNAPPGEAVKDGSDDLVKAVRATLWIIALALISIGILAHCFSWLAQRQVNDPTSVFSKNAPVVNAIEKVDDAYSSTVQKMFKTHREVEEDALRRANHARLTEQQALLEAQQALANQRREKK
jgi:hypothetical protein